MNPKPLGALVNVATRLHPPIEVQSSTALIRDLSISRPEILEYLRTIAPDKQEIALLHALEVGVTEIVARRKRQPKSPS
jgi:hypothetical protein